MKLKKPYKESTKLVLWKNKKDWQTPGKSDWNEEGKDPNQ
jgi:hypothetical protein